MPRSKITSYMAARAAVGFFFMPSIATFCLWEERRRINTWKNSNPGKQYDMKFRSIAGTMGRLGADRATSRKSTIMYAPQ